MVVKVFEMRVKADVNLVVYSALVLNPDFSASFIAYLSAGQRVSDCDPDLLGCHSLNRVANFDHTLGIFLGLDSECLEASEHGASEKCFQFVLNLDAVLSYHFLSRFLFLLSCFTHNNTNYYFILYKTIL